MTLLGIANHLETSLRTNIGHASKEVNGWINYSGDLFLWKTDYEDFLLGIGTSVGSPRSDQGSKGTLSIPYY